MNPKDIRNNIHFNSMMMNNNGVYSSRRFAINVNNKTVGYVDIGQYASVLLSEDDINFKTSINKSIIASGVLALFIIIAMGLYFSKQLFIPIKKVANMSVDLSRGNFDTKYNTESNIKKLETLRKSVNILAEKLRYQDIIRKRLVSDISHEIKTPLNVLQNNIEVIADRIFPVTEERLNYLNEEVIRFGKLLDNLDVLKKFEAESTRLNFEEVFLDELIMEICKDFHMAAKVKNIKLDYSIEPGDRDNGIGIKKEDLPFIFERLYRGDKSRSQIEGSGIGLTIVKNVLQLHNASIDVESKEGEGTAFRVYFDKGR